jgi:hypothetical protein
MNKMFLAILGLFVIIIMSSGCTSPQSLITEKILISPQEIASSQEKYAQLNGDIISYMQTTGNPVFNSSQTSTGAMNLLYYTFYNFTSTDTANITVKTNNGQVWQGIWLYNGSKWVPVKFPQIS